MPVGKRPADERVLLVARPFEPVSPEVELAAQSAEANRAQVAIRLQVPEALPEKPHALIRSVRAELRRTKADQFGFLHLQTPGLPDLEIGRDSNDRLLRILHVVFSFAEQLGHEISRTDKAFDWLVQGERFLLRVHEMRDKVPHQPTAKELKEQAERERWRTGYSGKVYRIWDYAPSGRLTIEIRGDVGPSWGRDVIRDRWRDTRTSRLEDKLADIFVWLEPAAVRARERRLAIEEERRREAEAKRLRRLAWIRREAAQKVEQVLSDLAEVQAKLTRTEALIKYLESRKLKPGGRVARLVQEAKAYAVVLRQELEDAAIEGRLEEAKIEFSEELLAPALAGPPLPSWYQWS